MSINLSVPQDEELELRPRITVVGVGGAGGNAVNNMINAELEGVEFLVANTDAQALTFSKTDRRIQLGSGLTQGLGAGSKPEIGRAAAEETIEEINEYIKGSHMVFIAAGMGGGTGSGAAPVIARAARDLGILTVGVVTKPFQFEGRRRQGIADSGIEELEQYVDTLIIIPNQNLFRVANEKTTFADAFKMADDVLHSGVRGITDLMVMPGLINLDFADVRSVMSEMGKAMMGTGEAEGERRALDAAEAAIANPLLDDTSMAGANGVLINITGGSDMTLYEVDEAANRIRSEVDEDAYIIFGSTYDESMSGSLRVSVVATGIDAEAIVRPAPAVLSVHAETVSPETVPTGDANETPEAHSELEAAPSQAFDEPSHDELETSVSFPESETSDDQEIEFMDVALIETEATHEVLSEDSPNVETESEEFCASQAAGMPDSMIVPPSMPSALNEDAFIPPAPAAENGEGHIDAMAEAALLNGTAVADLEQPKAKEKGPSLFARVTGGAKNKVSAFGAKSEAVSSPKPSHDLNQEPDQDVPCDTAIQRTTSVMRSQGSAELEPILGGLEPEQRLQESQAEDDLLDIPAFLRRQAN